MAWFSRRKPESDATPAPASTADGVESTARILFLDDDPMRAIAFHGLHPRAVWVQTAAACIARLEEEWDEVHLDHDLGGEHFVDYQRDDCGMEVVRWICGAPRPHLRATRFTVHSHNPTGAIMMVATMQSNGYLVEHRPFGAPPPPPVPGEVGGEFAGILQSLTWLVRRLLRRNTDAMVYDYTEFRGVGLEQRAPPIERLDFDWVLPPRNKQEEKLE
jgi:hypothetical protein